MAKKKRNYLKLFYSLVIDAIGMASYIIPGIGELFDIIWAPISAILVYVLYGSIPFAITDFLEEISPGLDFIPTATIAWFYEHYKSSQDERQIKNAKRN